MMQEIKDDSLAFARTLVPEMPGWSVAADSEGWAAWLVNEETGAKLFVQVRDGRAAISPSYPGKWYDLYPRPVQPETSADVTRPVAQIVRQVTRKVIDVMMPELERIRQAADKKAEDALQRSVAVEEFKAACPISYERGESLNWSPDVQGYADIRHSHDGTDCSLDIHYVPHSVALEIGRVLAAYAASSKG